MALSVYAVVPLGVLDRKVNFVGVINLGSQSTFDLYTVRRHLFRFVIELK